MEDCGGVGVVCGGGVRMEHCGRDQTHTFKSNVLFGQWGPNMQAELR